MERKTCARGAAVLFALGSLLAALMVFAGPANAEDSGAAVADETSTASGGCVAVNGSVCSGSGLAANGSTSSGDAVAVDGSVASGCSTAIDNSTASGGACAPVKEKAPAPEHHRRRPPRHEAPEAGPATPTGAVELAFTGSSTGPLAAAGALALALGLVLVALASERWRPVHSS